MKIYAKKDINNNFSFFLSLKIQINFNNSSVCTTNNT